MTRDSARPDAIRDIVAADPATFRAGEANAILEPVMGQHSLLIVDGDVHRRARRLLMPAFSGRAMRGYDGLVADLARREIRTWRPGVPFCSLERMNALTLEVILRVVVGVTDAARLARLRPVVSAIVGVNPVVLLGPAFPALRRFGMWRRADEAIGDLDRLIHAEIRERRVAPDLESRTDVLSQLIRVDDDGDRLTDAELRDQLVTLLLAGHETTATALAWALYEVGRSPVRRRRTALHRSRFLAHGGCRGATRGVLGARHHGDRRGNPARPQHHHRASSRLAGRRLATSGR
jgi:cytochrome P450 family 135